MDINIVNYDNSLHRSQVVQLWKSIFRYQDQRNNPSLVIDKKIQINDNLFFIALYNESVVGTIMAGYDGHRGWIYSLAVRESMRRNSIGTKLLHHAENALIPLGCVKINLQILESNAHVSGFYKKNGYNIEARISMGKEIKSNQ